MRGLVKYGLYSCLYGAIIGIVLISLVVVFGILVDGNQKYGELVYLIGFYCSTFLPILALSGIRPVALGRWSLFEISLPVKRDRIVSSKYIIYLILLLIGVAYFLLFHAIVLDSPLRGKCLQDLVMNFLPAIIITFIVGAIYFFLLSFLEKEKTELVLAFALFLAVFIEVGFSIVFEPIYINNTHTIIDIDILKFVFALLLYSISWVGSILIYKKKEF